MIGHENQLMLKGGEVSSKEGFDCALHLAEENQQEVIFYENQENRRRRERYRCCQFGSDLQMHAVVSWQKVLQTRRTSWVELRQIPSIASLWCCCSFPPPPSGKGSKRTWVYVVVGVAASLFVLIVVLAVVYYFVLRRRRRRRPIDFVTVINSFEKPLKSMSEEESEEFLKSISEIVQFLKVYKNWRTTICNGEPD
uniref:Uncharacterized protein n=1 Tax=Nelumbo nucifera TaxID=4432 RepID=A0A822XYX2_NELNU|nr:TPA_asm: hypothetical protein HUJ06_026387 [Nelumbo nucifera]